MSTDAAEFLANMEVLSVLLAAADSHDPAVVAASSAKDTRLVKIAGILEQRPSIVPLQLWSHRYQEPLRLMKVFRDGYVAGAPSKEKDLRELAEASEVAIQAAVSHLTNSDQPWR